MHEEQLQKQTTEKRVGTKRKEQSDLEGVDMCNCIVFKTGEGVQILVGIGGCEIYFTCKERYKKKTLDLVWERELIK